MAGTYNLEAPGPDRSDAIASLRVAITGGTSGLGLALVRELVARGARVAFVARDRGRVERVAAATGAHGIVGDVSRKEDIHPIALQAVGLLGGLDVLINNASSLGPVPLRQLGDTDCEDLELALSTNLVGPFRLTKALLGALCASAREGRGAVVLNVSSDAAINAYPGWGAYGASKAALHHLSRIWQEEMSAAGPPQGANCAPAFGGSAAAEWVNEAASVGVHQGMQGVRFLSLDPGDMDTPLHALAVPDAEPATLKRPADAAREMIGAIERALLDLRSSAHAGPCGSVDAGAVATACA
jgi:NAD(P)-dependent dehydrogenase (short-subunit alcohol dehydrogenase family)